MLLVLDQNISILYLET